MPTISFEMEMGEREDADDEVKTSRMECWLDVLSEFCLCLVNCKGQSRLKGERKDGEEISSLEARPPAHQALQV